MAKYEQHKLPGGSAVKVVPLVMEHFGSWVEEARNFLQKLAAFHQMKQEDLMLNFGFLEEKILSTITKV